MDEAQVNQVIKKNKDVLLKQMSDLIATQVASLKRSAGRLKRSRRPTLVRFLRRRVTRSSIKRPRKCWTQWKMRNTKYNLEGGNLEAAKSAVDQGITLVKDRQKLILLADKNLSMAGKLCRNICSMNQRKIRTMRRKSIGLSRVQPRIPRERPSNGMLLETRAQFLRLNLLRQLQVSHRQFPRL